MQAVSSTTILFNSRSTQPSFISLPRHSFRELVQAVAKDAKVLLLYCVPAFLYCLYNNLAFVNLSKFDPTSYYLLLQFRVVITGVLFQVSETRLINHPLFNCLYLTLNSLYISGR